MFDDFRSVIVPGMTHWNHPGWIAYFPGNNSPPSILGEMLTAAMGAQCMSWATSPAATELEQTVMEWLRQMVGLPEGFTGVIQDTASTATLVALLTAREQATGHSSGQHGLAATGAALTVYASREAHSSVDKAVKLAGYGLDHLRHISTDAVYALKPDELDAAITADRAAGRIPACVVASIGTTSSTAVDPVAEIAAICRRHGVWLHVDAAYAGTAAIVPELRGPFAGVELADSFVFNPHKWMLTNFDCTAYFVRDTDALLRTFQATPEYLRTAHDDAVVNYRDWGIQLGRRFRALKLWFVIRSYGVEGLRAMIRAHVALAQELAATDRRARRFRGDGAGAVRTGVLPSPALRRIRGRPRWAQPAAARASERHPTLPSDPHPARWALCDPDRGRPADHRTRAHRCGVERDSASRAEIQPEP